MYRIEERIGSIWRTLPRVYPLDVAEKIAERTATCCPPRSNHRQRGYRVRVVELATGTTVATYPKAEATEPGATQERQDP